VLQRLAPSLEASQMAWNRMAKRWGELTSPASRTNPALVGAASEVRATRGSGEAWVVGRGVADDVGDLGRGDHIEVEGLDGLGRSSRFASWSGVAHPA
jgi:hypothetical protein